MSNRPARGRGLGTGHGIGIAFVCSLFLLSLQYAGAFELLDLRLFDLRYFLRGERRASEQIAIVEIDDRTVAAFGTSPLPRVAMALLLDALERSGARAIGVDIQFIGTRDRAADSLLAAVTAENRNIVHAIAFFSPDSSVQSSAATSVGGRADRMASLRTRGAVDPGIHAPVAGSVVLPYEELLASATSLGHISVEVDRDGTMRRVPLLIRFGDRLYPALALSLLGAAAGDASIPELRPMRSGYELQWKGGRRIFVPTEPDGSTAIDFVGDRGAFRRSHSMLEVLQRYRAGDWTWLREAFQGRIILVGNTALQEATTDVGATPFSAATPLVFVHANALDSLLRGRFLRRPPQVPYLAALAAASVALGWAFVIFPLSALLAVMGAWLALGAGVDWLLFVSRGIVIPPTMWILLPVVVYAAVESYRLVFLERRSREQVKELQMARAIQRRLLPDASPGWTEFDVHGLNIPAREVGGDYYDWLPLGENELVVGLGDVSGKGVAAALLMAHLHASFHASVGEGVGLSAEIRAMHTSLYRSIEPGRFATFFLAHIPRAGDTLSFCNAGHNPGVLVHCGEAELLGATGLPLGAIEGAEYEESKRGFEVGDLLVLYSDGITECPSGELMYGEERLVRLVVSLAKKSVSSAQICEDILDDVRAFSSGNLDADDVTLLAVRRVGTPEQRA